MASDDELEFAATRYDKPLSGIIGTAEVRQAFYDLAMAVTHYTS